ncbi:MAG: hypothetical protein WEA61_01965 [Anaerolineales bacterium]
MSSLKLLNVGVAVGLGVDVEVGVDVGVSEGLASASNVTANEVWVAICSGLAQPARNTTPKAKQR